MFKKINSNIMNTIRINLCLLAVLFLTINIQAQSHFLTLSSELGVSGLNYKLEGVDNSQIKSKFGWNACLSYGYFFSPNWGLSTGLGIAHFKTVGGYTNTFSQENFYNLGTQITDDISSSTSKEYELRVRLGHWEEVQQGYIMEIPLTGMFQHKFGREQKQGLYINLGFKLKIPVGATYQVQDGESAEDFRLNVSGFFQSEKLEIGAPVTEYTPVPQHGFGSIHNPYERLNWQGDIDMKIGIAMMAEFGFSFQLAPRLDLLLGAFIDYNLNNMKKTADNTSLLIAPENYHPAANNNIANGIAYNGLLNSDEISQMKALSYGGKISFRIKLGSLSTSSYSKSRYRR